MHFEDSKTKSKKYGRNMKDLVNCIKEHFYNSHLNVVFVSDYDRKNQNKAKIFADKFRESTKSTCSNILDAISPLSREREELVGENAQECFVTNWRAHKDIQFIDLMESNNANLVKMKGNKKRERNTGSRPYIIYLVVESKL